jgi:hypothetical protein
MKDFHDLCTLAGRREFDGPLLTRAIRATFERRQASLALVADVLAEEFYADAILGQRWRAFAKGLQGGSLNGSTFAEVGETLRRFLGPLGDALSGKLTLRSWTPEQGWTSGRA